MSTLELWAGAECTINRVGARYFDQCVRTGHRERLEDIDRLAALGVKSVRFPVLWEAVAPETPERTDFSWQDAALTRLRELGIEPIIGLLHHGSGPRYATFDSSSFVEGLARFAATVARRYPWATLFTPVNEPLTTARFAGLYGHWYPHGRDTATFLRLLWAEIAGTAAAMRAIRTVTPHAQLLQTEDAGRTFGTRRLAAQCEYENDRRWLTFDLLCGRVDRTHPLRQHLREHGIADHELDALVATPCPPAILGLNYYVTSDRFIDERLERYPRATHGGNAFMAYADVEAVRVRGAGIAGHATVLRDAFERYQLPVALTEVHLGCSREEQLRWLLEAWRAAERARADGIDVRALTLWSVFGSIDWSSLLTRERNDYEPGAYDVRGEQPRATALQAAARALVSEPLAPLPAGMAHPGWWRRPARFAYPIHGPHAIVRPVKRGAPLLAIGTGSVCEALPKAAARRALELERVATPERAREAFIALRPWGVLVDAEDESAPQSIDALVELATICAEARVPFVFLSSDRVFAGDADAPYAEHDTPGPRCVRGHSHWQAERALEALADHVLIARTGPLLDATHPRCALRRWLLDTRDDDVVSPTYVPHLLDAALDLLLDREHGVWHLASEGHASWREVARWVFGTSIERASQADLQSARSMHALRSTRASLLPSLDAALEAYVIALPKEHARNDAA